MKPVRYGIVGFGGIAENRIAREGFGLDRSRFPVNTTASLVAACDMNETRKDSAEKLGITWFSDYDRMLADESIDAIVIATNNCTHAPLAKRALQAGKHIFLEKPAGVSIDEVTELIELAEEYQLSIGVDHMMTKNSFNIRAKELLKENGVGTIEQLVIHMEFAYGLVPEEAATWRCAEPSEIGGPIGDVGSHCFYMIEFLLDDTIDSLQCVYTPKHTDIAVEDGAVIYATTRSGIPCTIRVAFDQKRGTLHETISNLGFEVYGDKGVLTGEGTIFQFSGHEDEPITMSLAITSDGKRTPFASEDIQNIYQEQIGEHARSIQEGIPFTGKDGLHNLELILLSHESAAKNGMQVTTKQ